MVWKTGGIFTKRGRPAYLIHRQIHDFVYTIIPEHDVRLGVRVEVERKTGARTGVNLFSEFFGPAVTALFYEWDRERKVDNS